MFAAISIQIQQRISLLTPISCSNSEQIAMFSTKLFFGVQQVSTEWG